MLRIIAKYRIAIYLWLAFLGDYYVDGLAQDCSNSIADALELLQSCAKPSMLFFFRIS